MKIGGWVAAVTILWAAIAGEPSLRPASGAEQPITIVALGDSLTAGYGVRASEAFPVKLLRALVAKGMDVRVINAGVSGDTTSGGLARLDWSVPDGVEGVILELGANDALRGTDPAVTRNALDTMLRRLGERKIPVLLCGMLAPRNLGADYANAFDAIFPDLASQYGAILYPFFLDGVMGDRKLNQPDGLHPLASGVDVIVSRVLPDVERLIARIRARRSGHEG
jgi:acyl-CoA thioesterase-1